MDFFDSKTVVGLFDDQEDLGQALSSLHKQGFGEEEDEVILIDKDHLAGESPNMRQNKPVVLSSSFAVGVQAGNMPDDEDTPADDDVSEKVLEDKLMDLGVDEAEVNFYARQVKRGHTLVVVETDDDKAQQAYNIMRRFNAKSSIS